MFLPDPTYFAFALPPFLLMLWAQSRVKSAFRQGMSVPASLSGAAAARHILDSAGLSHVEVEETHGSLSDHYDPRGKVLRLSREVYHGRTAASVGIAAHEAGHALQDATNYGLLVVRNAAVPAAKMGPTIAIVLLMIGWFINSMGLIWLGILAFGAAVFFQVVNLPVEFDASNRAKVLLNDMRIVDQHGAGAVRSVLNAAAWTYVAGTLQSVMTLLYYIMRFAGGSRSD